ncbi:MAG: muramoyltetrapeptide carboxypeptidase [Humisphaera sp.]|nr:muramoyltetrapeptide carboxypeptidase [Humisphaera sp.]
MEVSRKIPVGIFAASSVVPKHEFDAGVEHLRKFGFDPRIEAQVASEHFIFPGDDDERATAIYRLALDPKIPILWAARGGYGAGRLLPLLEKLTTERGVPKQKKLLVGYSDVTVLHEFVRARWGWSTLHAPMPAASNFAKLDPREWDAIVDYVKGKPATPPWLDATLRWMNNPPRETIRTELIGGNLSLCAALAGTRFAQAGKGKIVFLEDVDEPFYRIDRMMIQLEQSGMLDGAAAIVLGDFTNCKDERNYCLASAASPEKKPLRKIFEQDEAFEHIFSALGQRIDVPIAIGLPVGHGPYYAPLPLGAQYELTAEGKLKLLDWDWLPHIA